MREFVAFAMHPSHVRRYVKIGHETQTLGPAFGTAEEAEAAAAAMDDVEADDLPVKRWVLEMQDGKATALFEYRDAITNPREISDEANVYAKKVLEKKPSGVTAVDLAGAIVKIARVRRKDARSIVPPASPAERQAAAERSAAAAQAREKVKASVVQEIRAHGQAKAVEGLEQHVAAAQAARDGAATPKAKQKAAADLQEAKRELRTAQAMLANCADLIGSATPEPSAPRSPRPPRAPRSVPRPAKEEVRMVAPEAPPEPPPVEAVIPKDRPLTPPSGSQEELQQRVAAAASKALSELLANL